MSFFTNKHVITAMIVAPILAVLSYYMVDLSVKEQPHKAVAGSAYKLIAKSNCRFSSGACDLENGSFKSTVRVSLENGQQLLHLSSDNRLQTASIGFVTNEGVEVGPFNMIAVGENGNDWKREFNVPADASTLLRVALVADDTHYYSETSMGFSDYKTSFSKDFRKNN